MIIAVFLIAQNKKSEQPTHVSVDDSVFQDPNINATQLCYIWNTEAGDQAQLSMDIRANQVIGEFNWRPAEKDSKTGIFRGTVSGGDTTTLKRTVNALWDASAEGVTNKEELIITFGEGIANVGFGEMKDRGDGVYVYVDKDHVNYESNLSQTDCGDEAMD